MIRVSLVQASAYQPHSPITIIGNKDFTSANGVTGGTGTPPDPYIIQGWDINASGIGCCNAYGNAGIDIQQTNASFIVRNVYVHQGLPVDEGISLRLVSNGLVENTVTSKDYFGIVVASSTNVTVTGNTVSSNNPYGIYLYQTTKSLVDANDVSSNNVGIFLFSANSTIVSNNNVHDSSVIGVDTYTTRNDTFVANNVSSNGWIGLRLLYSDYDLVYHNNFISNGQNPPPYNQGGIQISDSPLSTSSTYNPPQNTTNSWDDGYPTGGNYYSDGIHLDTCSGPAQNICYYSDGINDGPYLVRSDYVYNYQGYFYYIARDRYPLERAYSTTTVMPSFMISSATSPTLSPDSSSTFTVRLVSLHNYAGPITISATTDAPNCTISPSLMNINVPPGSQASPTLTVSASSKAPIGTYHIDVQGSDGSTSHATRMALIVMAASQPPNSQPPTKPPEQPATHGASPSLTPAIFLIPTGILAVVAGILTISALNRKKSLQKSQPATKDQGAADPLYAALVIWRLRTRT
jgi:parallel beta-helix repeat protein